MTENRRVGVRVGAGGRRYYLEDVVVELAPEPPLISIFPLLVYNFEGDILVRRAGGDPGDLRGLKENPGVLKCVPVT